jgi:hypothetical protein
MIPVARAYVVAGMRWQVCHFVVEWSVHRISTFFRALATCLLVGAISFQLGYNSASWQGSWHLVCCVYDCENGWHSNVTWKGFSNHSLAFINQCFHLVLIIVSECAWSHGQTNLDSFIIFVHFPYSCPTFSYHCHTYSIIPLALTSKNVPTCKLKDCMHACVLLWTGVR